MTLQTYKIPGLPYDGAGISSHQSADGSVFFVYSGKNPDGVFKQQVARFHKKKWQWYDVPIPHHARPTATLEPDGLYITYYTDKEGTTRRWKVPDFVTPAFAIGSDVAPQPPPTGEVIDVTAREQNRQQATQIEALRKELNELKKQVQQRPSGGLTWLQIKDHLWTDNIINDKVYSDLSQKGGIYGMIEAIVKSIVGK